MPIESTAQKRLRILGDDEIEALYGRPRFTEEERVHYFSLSPTEKAVLGQFHSLKSRIYWILQLGYFKAKHLFFTFEFSEVAEDARYLQEQFFPDLQFSELDSAPLRITKVTRLKQRRSILELCRYRLCGAQERRQLQAKARQAARVSSKPVFIFRELLQHLSEQRIVAPGYSLLQDTVGQALTYEQERLVAILHAHLTGADHAALSALLNDAQGLHEITLLKREPRDFSLGEIKRTCGRI